MIEGDAVEVRPEVTEAVTLSEAVAVEDAEELGVVVWLALPEEEAVSDEDAELLGVMEGGSPSVTEGVALEEVVPLTLPEAVIEGLSVMDKLDP